MPQLAGELSFITVVDNPAIDLRDVPRAKQESILGPEWGLRREPELKAYIKDLLEYGYNNVAACKAIITTILSARAANRNPFSNSGAWPNLYVVANDAVSGFDSEAGVDGCGSVLLNMTTRGAWKDGLERVWQVPLLLVVYHELGHYAQYVSMPAEYDEIAKSKLEKEDHVLDAWNLPSHEYPICEEIGMGVREKYLDMQEASAPQFAQKAVSYASKLADAYAKDSAITRFKRYESPQPVRMSGAMAPTTDCQYCNKKNVNTAVHFNPEAAFRCKAFKFPAKTS